MILKNKKFWRYLSLISIFTFLILWIIRLFPIGEEYISMGFQNIFVIIYLISELRYHRILVSEKNAKIQELELALKKEE